MRNLRSGRTQEVARANGVVKGAARVAESGIASVAANAAIALIRSSADQRRHAS